MNNKNSNNDQIVFQKPARTIQFCILMVCHENELSMVVKDFFTYRLRLKKLKSHITTPAQHKSTADGAKHV